MMSKLYSKIENFAVVNFGDESLALIQWLIDNKWQDKTTLLSVDTGFSAEDWQGRVQEISNYCKVNGLDVVCLKPPFDFSQAVIDRNSFPSQKFQWCASFLKGCAINQFLDDVDFEGKARVLLSKRKESSRINAFNTNIIVESEHYEGRTVLYPLWELCRSRRNELIKRTGFAILGHRSKECEPCIHASRDELMQLSEYDTKRLSDLEGKIGQAMFSQPINELKKTDLNQEKKVSTSSTLERFDMGCGSPWGCGE